jgi:hypothetical protein
VSRAWGHSPSIDIDVNASAVVAERGGIRDGLSAPA